MVVVDADDNGCETARDNSEDDTTGSCTDGIDNDEDGMIGAGEINKIKSQIEEINTFLSIYI